VIICHEHEFIFIKTSKTAGTSVEIALSRHCGEDDIISSIKPEDEITRRETGGRGPQHHLAPLADYRLADVSRLIRKGKQKRRFYHHMPADEIRERVGAEIFDRYYKFCIVRNPWDRFVSLYYWRFKTEPRPSLREFAESSAARTLRERSFDLYTIDGEIVVDRVCRFENMAEDLEAVRRKVGIPEPLELPHAKSRFRSDKRSYRELLGAAEQALVAELCQQEIDLFGYEF
jgi:hypothetical protein